MTMWGNIWEPFPATDYNPAFPLDPELSQEMILDDYPDITCTVYAHRERVIMTEVEWNDI